MTTKNQIARTNKFYLEISKKILSEKEYDVLHRLLIDNQSMTAVAKEYKLSAARIRQIFANTYDKVKSIAETFQDIAYYKQKREELRTAYINERNDKPTSATPLLDKTALLSNRLLDSNFPFSKRLYNMFELLDVRTIGDLRAIPLNELKKYRGFKKQCKKELIAFIEFEDLENLFEGFYKWKTE